MSNYDDIFANSQNENQVENAAQEFNKEDWVAKKQMKRLRAKLVPLSSS